MTPTPILPETPRTPTSAQSAARVQTMKANSERRQMSESTAMKNEEEKLTVEREKKALADKSRKQSKEDQEMSGPNPTPTTQKQKLPEGDKRAKRNLEVGEDKAEKRQAEGSPAWVDSRKRPAISVFTKEQRQTPSSNTDKPR